MSGNKVGIGSVPGTGKSQAPFQTGGSAISYARVYDVLLTDDAARAIAFNVPQGTIGAIQFRYISNNTVDESLPLLTATSFSPHHRSFPIKNEIVEVVSGPTNSASSAKGNNIPGYYYKGIVGVWDSVEHNSIPDSSFNSTEGPVTGTNFTENGIVTRLQHLPGDHIQEGRFGNSIRMGSSNKSINAPWKGTDGSPIVVIRNGQSAQVGKTDRIILEDINADGGSVYMLSDQTINFIPSNLNFDTYHQDVNTAVKSNVITPTVTPPSTPTTSSVAADAAAPATDTAPVQYNTPIIPVTGSVDDEISFLPDREDPVFYQEFEEDAPRHVSGDNSRWISGVNSTVVTYKSFMAEDAISGFSPYFIAYMQHQQGPSGIKAIIASAKKGLPSVSSNNGFTKENIQYNMSRNVGRDFGTTQLTPANFIKYWKTKFTSKQNEASGKHPAVESTLIKYANTYGVPIDFVKTVCDIESGFNPSDGNNTYQGLFAISMKEFHSIYPNDNDIKTVDKNINVGVRILKTWLGSVSNILNAAR